MDKLIELLLGLRKDVDALRDDVHVLADKVDHLAVHDAVTSSTTQHVNTVKNAAQESSYGRQLSASEQAYLDRLHNGEKGEQGVYSPANNQIPQPRVDHTNASIPTPPTPRPMYQRASSPSVIERFFAWFAKDWPMKVGGFFVIAAIGWFVTFASQQGWLSETARVILGYIFAIGCIAFGALRAERERVQGNLFLIIGSAGMLITTIAGIDYAVPGITAVSGLFIMLLSVGFVTLVSLTQKSYALTTSLIFFGAIVPMFFFSYIDVNMLYLYLFILTVGTLWIVWYTQWRGLTTLMLCVVGFYSVTYIADAPYGSIESLSNIVISFIFIGVFYIANISAVIRSRVITANDIVTAIGIGILFLIWMLNFTSREFEVFVLLIGALFFAYASYAVYRIVKNRAAMVLYGGSAMTILVIATALQFKSASLIVAYIAEATIFGVSILYFMRAQVTQFVRVGVLAMYAVPLFMTLVSVAQIFSYIDLRRVNPLGIFPDLFVVFVTCISAFALAIAVLRLLDGDDKENMTMFRIFAYVGGVYALLLIWFVTHVFMFDHDVATFVSLVIYTVFGVIFYVMGARGEYKPYMVVGSILFGVVVARVLLVEFWAMDVLMRIITSFVLGTLLISTAFIRSSNKR